MITPVMQRGEDALQRGEELARAQALLARLGEVDRRVGLGRHLDVRQPDPAERVPVLVAFDDVEERRGRDLVAGRRRHPVGDPLVQSPPGPRPRARNTPMLSGSVAPLKGTPNTQFGAVSCGSSRCDRGALVEPLVQVDVRGPGQLPGPQVGVVGLPGRTRPPAPRCRPRCSSWMNGVVLSVRIRAGNGENATRPLPIGAARADRPTARKPSNAWLSGWIALT